MAFKVISIIDGDTIRVSPNYVLGEHKGNIVKVKGYRSPNEQEQSYTIKRLSKLLLNNEVELRNSQKYNDDSEAILSQVYLNGVDVATYFPEIRNR